MFIVDRHLQLKFTAGEPFSTKVVNVNVLH